MDEFVADMERMFQDWLDENTEQHKYYPIFLAIRDRYRRCVAKAQSKLVEGKDTSCLNTLY